MRRFWTVVGWLWATGWAALGFFAMVDRGTATTNIGSWIEPLDGILGPHTDMWIKIIGGAMIAIPICWWLFMKWRDKFRKKPLVEAVDAAINDQKKQMTAFRFDGAKDTKVIGGYAHGFDVGADVKNAEGTEFRDVEFTAREDSDEKKDPDKT